MVLCFTVVRKMYDMRNSSCGAVKGGS